MAFCAILNHGQLTLVHSQVMEVLLRRHGVNLSGVKSNLYTAIGTWQAQLPCERRAIEGTECGHTRTNEFVGLDSKHPSGIQSTVSPCGAI